MVELKRGLSALHPLLKRYSVYLLGFWTLLAGTLLAARFVYSDSRQLGFLAWNLFLAAVPYLASLWAEAENALDPQRWRRLIAPAIIWLLFLPNAPYIVTDLIHLHRIRPPIPLWYDAVLVFTFALAGCLFGVVSLRIMQGRVRTLAGRTVAWIFTLTAIGLCGPGIYVGRVLRWNSWHVLTRPDRMARTVLGALADPLSHWPAIVASAIFATFVLGCYVTCSAFWGEGADDPSQTTGES